MSEHNGEATEEMPTELNDQGSSNGGSVLYVDPPAIGEPSYPVALDLLGMVMGRCAAEIRKQEGKARPDTAMISRYREIEDVCFTEQAELREYDQDGLVEAISRYRQLLDEIWPYRDGEPQ